MTQAPTGPPLYMRRNGFDPTPELREIREGDGVRKIKGAFDLDVYLVTRHEDVKEVLGGRHPVLQPAPAAVLAVPR